MKTSILPILITFLAFTSCTEVKNESIQNEDPLPSWNEGFTKSSLISFVQETTQVEGDHFIPVTERIAVFDNDGTLWSEKPVYFQLLFAMDRVKKMAEERPEWTEEQPFKAVLEDDMESLGAQGVEGLLKIVMATHAGMSAEEFGSEVKDWLSTAKHPRFNRPYTDLVYQPMLELIDYLESKNFKVFIVSGGGIDFMRPWVESVYGIPKDQVVGSSIKTEFKWYNGNPIISRLPEIDFIDDKEGKPVGIHKHIGRKPVFAAGNSDGDLAMMQWTDSREGRKMMLYVHHTDSIREWAYDRHSSVGKFGIALDEARTKGWTIIDMAKDWKLIYPFEHQNK